MSAAAVSARAARGSVRLVEERRGSLLSRWVRIGARGRDETAPAVLLTGVTLVVGAFVALVILAAVLIWVFAK